MGRLSDKIILITGAARGQGAAEAALCLAEGATVHMTDIRDDEGGPLADRLSNGNGGRAHYHHLDVADEDGWVKVTAAIKARHGHLDGLVNNAGIFFGSPLEATELGDWNRVLASNLTGPFLGIKHCAPLLRLGRGGAIVNIGSIAGLTGVSTTVYSASKWGLRGLTKSAAILLRGDGIRVNAVQPGLVDTPINAGFPDLVKTAAANKILGRPEDIANLVLFLLSDESSFITGADIAADGGALNGMLPNPS